MLSAERYAGFQFVDCGDPAGSWMGNSAQDAPEYTTLAEHYGIDVDYMLFQEIPTKNRVNMRVTAIHNKLREYVYQRQTPGLLVDKERTPILHRALIEQYRYRVRKDTKQVTDQIDEQHPSEDAVDCLGYTVLFRFGLATTSNSKKDVAFDNQSSLVWNDVLRRGH
jgi:hypothetical protein